MRLREIRQAMGISQSKAARDLNLSPNVYGRYENGQREPSNLVLLAMADYFCVTVDELLGREINVEKETETLDEFTAFKRKLQQSPEYEELIKKAENSKPEHVRAAIAVLNALEPMA